MTRIGMKLDAPVHFFHDTATPQIYTLSLHDALPILRNDPRCVDPGIKATSLLNNMVAGFEARRADRKSTRLNSSHSQTSYAVFCLKKKIGRELGIEIERLGAYLAPRRFIEKRTVLGG